MARPLRAAGFAGTSRSSPAAPRRPGVAILALGLAVPVLSLAWGNESAARRNEHEAENPGHSQGRGSPGAAKGGRPERGNRSPRASGCARERDEGQRREGPRQKALEFLVAAFRKPDPALDGRSLKVVDLLDGAVREINQIISAINR